MFRNLCGEGGFKNVVVLTTFWDKVTNEEGRQREQQLKSQYFKELVQGGARFMQHDRSLLSAQEVLMHVLTLVPTNVRIQEEIRVDGKNLGDTAAGSIHRMEVEALITKHRKELDELKAEMDEVKNTNAALARELKEEQDEMQQKLKVWESERNELKMDLDKSKMTVEQLKADVGAQKNQGITDVKWTNFESILAQFEEQKSELIDAERRANAAEIAKLKAELRLERNGRSCCIQ